MTVPQWFEDALGNATTRSVALGAALASAPVGPVRDRALQELRPSDADLVGVTVLRREKPDDLMLSLLCHDIPEVRAAAAVQFTGEHGLKRADLPEAWVPKWRAAMLSARPRGHGDFELASALTELVKEAPAAVEDWYAQQLEAAPGDSAWQVLGHELFRPLPHLPRANRISLLKRIGDRWWVGDLFREMVHGDAAFVTEALDQGAVNQRQAIHAVEDVERTVYEGIAPLLLDRKVPAAALAAALDRGYVGSKSKHYGELVGYCEDLTSRSDERLVAIGTAGMPLFQKEQEVALAEERQARVSGTI